MKIDKQKIMIQLANTQTSIGELAKRSGLSSRTISNAVKGGKCFPSTAGKIAKALSVNVVDIIEMEV